jgi:hypothetical protein
MLKVLNLSCVEYHRTVAVFVELAVARSNKKSNNMITQSFGYCLQLHAAGLCLHF